MNYIVVAYFTPGTLYEQEVKRLIASLIQFDIPYVVTPIENKGDWYKNTQYKPVFLKEMLNRYKPKSIIYVDADAEFCRYPDLFEELHVKSNVNIAVHLLDHTKRGRPQAKFEMLSGTIFLKNNIIVENILDKWIEVCQEGGDLWDQVALSRVLREIPYYVLPEEYCTIFDYMADVVNPVIKHYQASRKTPGRGHGSLLPKSRVPPRVIEKGGLVRYRRRLQ